jgi:nitrous oxidase accessory protein NosD
VDGFRSGMAVVDGYEDKNCFQEGNLLIENNTVTGCLRGFTLYKNPHCETLGRNALRIRILNNRFTCGPAETSGEASGIWLPNLTAAVEIRENTVRHFRHGVWMGGFVDFIHIGGNAFEDCTTGVTLETVSPDTADHVAHVKETGNTFTRTAPHSQGLSQAHVRGF